MCCEISIDKTLSLLRESVYAFQLEWHKGSMEQLYLLNIDRNNIEKMIIQLV